MTEHLKVSVIIEEPETYFTEIIGRLKDFALPNGDTPQSPLSEGVRGQIRWDNNNIYLCVADNMWMRTELKTWSHEQQNDTNRG